MKKIALISLFGLLAGQANAESELERKAKVLNVMKMHAESIACETDFEKPLESLLSNVIKIQNTSPYEFDESSTYYVLWAGDLGCQGGSGSMSYHISEVGKILTRQPYLVQNNNPFGDDIFAKINHRFISKIDTPGKDKIVIFSHEHAEGDSNNFPSLEYKYILTYKDSKWDLTEKIYLGIRSYAN